MVIPEKDSACIINKGMYSKEVQTSPAVKIMKYKKLLDEGIITSNEFEKKKQNFLICLVIMAARQNKCVIVNKF